jgi:hypothetical protein
LSSQNATIVYHLCDKVWILRHPYLAVALMIECLQKQPPRIIAL